MLFDAAENIQKAVERQARAQERESQAERINAQQSHSLCHRFLSGRHGKDPGQNRADTGRPAEWFLVADMNLDGRPDVLLAHSEKPGYPVSWYAAPVDPKTDPWAEHVIGWMDKCHNLKVADLILTGTRM